MRCLTCKYDLRNLSENRCPECGRAFDPNDSSTFVADRSFGSVFKKVLRFLYWVLVTYWLPSEYADGIDEPKRKPRTRRDFYRKD